MRRVMLITVMAALAGCGGEDPGSADLAATADLAVGVDMAGPAPLDFAIGTNSDGAIACSPAGGAKAQYAWNAMLLPMQRQDYAYDLNGDGRVDNQFGNIEGALAGQGLDDQTTVDQAIASGQAVTLMDEQSADVTFTADACAASALYAGQAQASPDFSGKGHFTVDGAVAPGRFSGPIAASRFTSAPPPAQAAVPVVVHLQLPFFGSIVGVDLVGARVTYARVGSGAKQGQLNGAIRNSDVQNKMVPSIAAALTAKVKADPSSSQSMQILSIFDTGGKSDPACASNTCKNPDGTCAVAMDGTISTCEVATNSLMANLLAPDVQMFDANGDYRPNPANTKKDCMSIGVAFTAVAATF